MFFRMRSMGFSRFPEMRRRIPMSFCVSWRSWALCCASLALNYSEVECVCLLVFFASFFLFLALFATLQTTLLFFFTLCLRFQDLFAVFQL